MKIKFTWSHIHFAFSTSAIALFIPLLLAAGCSTQLPTKYLSTESRDSNLLSNQTLRLNSSAEISSFSHAEVIIDNSIALEKKLAAIRSATDSLELAYYIFEPDYSSSLIGTELVAATTRGVRVRVLLDYQTNYKNIDYYSMLEMLAKNQTGSLEFRFYNRPTDIIIKDAAYLTLGCGEVEGNKDFSRCAESKFSAIDQQYQNYLATLGVRNQAIPSNFNTGGSGIFLSALYSKDIDLMAKVVIKGQEIDLASFSPNAEKNEPETSNSADKTQKIGSVISAGKIFWQSRASNDDQLQRLTAQAKLSLAFVLFGGTIRPIYDTITSYVPIGKRADAAQAARDWDYLTDFLHHKFLLSDGKELIIGGRNIEDSYHLSISLTANRYLFSDTDLQIVLPEKSDALISSYNSLWDYSIMVARLNEVRLHAPNDFLVADKLAHKHCSAIDEQVSPIRHQSCYVSKFIESYDLAYRMKTEQHSQEQRLKHFAATHQAPNTITKQASFPVDSGAQFFYLENLPFSRGDLAVPAKRIYGAENSYEGESGKYIHNIWLAGLRNACASASATSPQEVILHNAYFFLPSNLLKQLAQMVDGTLDCSNVNVIVITNSAETTDLNVINLAAAYSLRAFSAYSTRNRDPKRGASFSYYEYLPQGSGEKSSLSLHSKVSLLGSDIIVGSANADVRSYMMDSNNGMLIRNAPRLARVYRDYIAHLLSDDTRTVNRTDFFATTTREELLAGDRQRIKPFLLAAFSQQPNSKPAELSTTDGPEPVIDLILEVLDRVYLWSMEIMRQNKKAEIFERRYNAFYKLL